ncbi:hypothetical protein RB595_002173 [Gaeumannomyces hyphopodioides]
MDASEIYAVVKERYSAASTDPSQLSEGYGRAVARAFGYSEQELAGIPAESNLGLSCGNPLAIASLREGETVVDLGSGAGFDVFLAAQKVGPTGRAIGVDMNKDMLFLAERNKAKLADTGSSGRAEFVEGRITRVPLPDGVADAIVSNCVVNLVPEPEKHLAFAEMARLLRPGGRVAISDILARRPLPDTLRRSAALLVGCVAGASLVGTYEEHLKGAGFVDILIQDTHSDLNVYADTLPDGTKRTGQATAGSGQGCCAPSLGPSQAPSCCGQPAGQTAGGGGSCAPGPPAPSKDLNLEALTAELGNIDLNEWVGSYKIYAVKA